MSIQQNLLAFIFVVCISTVSFSQSKPKSASSKKIDVVKVYEQVVREGYGTPFIYKHLASAYYFKGEYAKSVLWFNKFYAEMDDNNPELEKQYKMALKAVAFSASNVANDVIVK